MTVLVVARIALRERRRAVLGWVVGVAALSALYVASYRSVSGAKTAAVGNYPAALRRALDLGDITTPTGYLGATVFGIPLLVLTAVFVTTAGVRTVASDEQSGALDLLLSAPVRRSAVVLGRTLAAALELLALGFVLGLVVEVLHPVSHLGIGLPALSRGLVTWWLLALCLLGSTVLAGAALGRVGPTVGVCAAVLATTYLAGTFLPLVRGLAWCRTVSPFAWAALGDALHDATIAVHVVLLVGTTGVSLTLACVAFGRRDLGV